VRIEFIAYFLALIAIPVAQVLADTASDRPHFTLWKHASTPSSIAVSKYHHTKTPFDYLFIQKQQRRQKTS
jgi:hypothetical protein